MWWKFWQRKKERVNENIVDTPMIKYYEELEVIRKRGGNPFLRPDVAKYLTSGSLEYAINAPHIAEWWKLACTKELTKRRTKLGRLFNGE